MKISRDDYVIYDKIKKEIREKSVEISDIFHNHYLPDYDISEPWDLDDLKGCDSKNCACKKLKHNDSGWWKYENR